jgi:hypothetical protein
MMMMIINSIVSFLLGVILTMFGQRILGGNKEFFRIINSFRKKLPPKNKKAKINNDEQLGVSHMALDSLKTYIKTSDIDYFLKELEDFNYDDLIFKKRPIVKYSKNIQRIIKTTKSESFTVGILQEILDSEEQMDRKPYISVLGFKLEKFIKC